MKSNATSTKPTARKSSGSRSRNPASVSESDLSGHDGSVADELDGAVDRTESPAVESEASDRVLEKTEIDIGELRAAVLESELMKSDRCDNADCGEEPPEPDDFLGDFEGFRTAYLMWTNFEGTAEEECQHISAEEIWNQSVAGIGSIYDQESVPVSLMPESNVGVEGLTKCDKL